jgi:TPR repeat protein
MARFEFSSEDVVDVSSQGGGTDALYQLGLTYCVGRDVEVNLVEAHKWFNLAAMRGNEDAKAYRLEISREMTKKEIAAAQKSAREWLRYH